VERKCYEDKHEKEMNAKKGRIIIGGKENG
jgi:hypothetical protein